MTSPLTEYLNEQDRRLRGIASQQQVSKWAEEIFTDIKRQLGSIGAFSDMRPKPHGRISVILQLHVERSTFDPPGPFAQTLRSELLADGWHSVEFENDRELLIHLVALPIDISVNEDGVFTPEIQEDESPDKAAERIARYGVWRHESSGARAFVPAHRVHSISIRPSLPDAK